MRKIAFLLSLLSFYFQHHAQSLNFDGIDDYVIAVSPGPTGTADRTVECWIKTSNSINSQQVLIDWGTMSPLGSRFTVNLINNGRLRIEVGGNGMNSTAQIANGMWHHIAVTYEHVATTKVRLYIDGNLDMSGNFTVGVNTAATDPIQLGRRNDGVNFYQGEMDEVRIWDIAKTATQIAADMNIEYCTNQVGLIAYFQLNDGVPSGMNTTVTTAENLINSSNNGILTNFSLTGGSSNWTAASSSLTRPLSNLISQVGSTIVASDSAATGYTWLDCNSNTSLTANMSRTYTPSVNGDYKVALQKGICIDTSTCLNFLSVGSGELKLNSTLIGFPNPAKNRYTLNIPTELQQKNGQVKLFAVNGALVYKNEISSFSDKLEINLESFENGIYYIQTVSETHNLMGKVIIEK